MIDRADRPTPSLENLTEKQFAVLEHLACHKTSKEIARDLGLARTTVDKHLNAVRRKWGTADRYQTVRMFEQLSKGGQICPPQFSPGDAPPPLPPVSFADLPKSAVFQLKDILASGDLADWDAPPPMGLQALDQRFGKLWRIVAIPVLALLAGMVLVWAVSFARTLSELF